MGGIFLKNNFTSTLLSKWKSISSTPLTIPISLLVCGTLSLFFQILTETVRQDGLLQVFLWLPSHFLPWLAGTVPVFLVMIILLFLCRRFWIACGSVGLFLFASSYATFFKQAYRGDPVLPIDIALATDAMGVMGGMDLSPTKYMILFGICLIVVCVLLFPFRMEKIPFKRLLIQLTISVACLAIWLPVVLWHGPIPKALGLSAITGRVHQVYNQGGFITGLLSYVGHTVPQKPSGYSQRAVEQAIEQLPPDKNTQSKPDIVVIMLESYYHLDNYPNVTGIEGLTQYYDALAKEGISGKYYSDKYSGGTADMEFGALTGFATAFLPEGVVPYVQYVAKNRDFPGYPAYLQQLGYRTIGIHPFDGEIYRRELAYPNMGFDTFLDKDEMQYTQHAGKYIADQQAAKELISQYEKASANGNPVFLHMVTMQNHIPNLPQEYPSDYEVQANMENIPEYYNDSLKSVVTGLRDADLMMKQITDYFRTVDREVIVLFFGDHQTAIGQQDGVELLDITKQLENLSEQEKWQAIHAVPYLMWSNKGCKNAGSNGGTFSSYMLMPTFLTEMEAPISPWFQWLYSTRDTIMGVNSGRIIHPDGSVSPVESATPEQKKVLQLQQTLQYSMMFGKKN